MEEAEDKIIERIGPSCVGMHVAPRATRFEPIRQGARRCFGGFAKAVARGPAIRHDHGSRPERARLPWWAQTLDASEQLRQALLAFATRTTPLGWSNATDSLRPKQLQPAAPAR
jgi:hypothetical protein